MKRRTGRPHSLQLQAHVKAWKNHARYQTWLAIKRRAVIPQGCEICGHKAHGHHLDYSDPMAVVWLCSRHHHDWHIWQRKGEQGNFVDWAKLADQERRAPHYCSRVEFEGRLVTPQWVSRYGKTA